MNYQEIIESIDLSNDNSFDDDNLDYIDNMTRQPIICPVCKQAEVFEGFCSGCGENFN